jgi:hypothetical protein
MLKWLKQKVTEFTSRKFISFLISEAVLMYLVQTGKLTESWAIIAGLLIPYILYVYMNGSIELNKVKINTHGVQINQEDAIGTDIPHDADAECDKAEGDDVPKINIPEVGFKFK